PLVAHEHNPGHQRPVHQWPGHKPHKQAPHDRMRRPPQRTRHHYHTTTIRPHTHLLRTPHTHHHRANDLNPTRLHTRRHALTPGSDEPSNQTHHEPEQHDGETSANKSSPKPNKTDKHTVQYAKHNSTTTNTETQIAPK